ncbi:hypothetical protein FZW96_11250 [Bacillus sp. BGMRC 2118]|nr:hypothetical protein FZW96_11250 [Bacillus sp. BGMRC 2118]
MKNIKFLLIFTLLGSWLTASFLKKRDVIRFLPASLFIALLVRGESVIARKRKWWWFYERVHPRLIGEFPMIWGPFFIGSMWILKLTFGKPFRYLALNMSIHIAFAYCLIDVLRKMGIASLVRLKRYQLVSLFTLKAWILYFVQFIVDKVSRR